MPTFHPPLSHTSTVLTQPGKYPFLSFYIAFESEDDTSGQWELWTDLATVDSEGHQELAQGEWHAIVFQPLITEDDSASDDIPCPNTLRLQPAAPTQLSPPPKTYQALAVLPSVQEASYSYTFRRILPDNGGTQWLGGEGSNGYIDLRPGRSERVGGAPHQSARKDGVEMEGFALSFQEADGTLNCSAVSLPHHEKVTCNLVIASHTLPIHLRPFSTALETPRNQLSSIETTHTLMADTNFQVLTILPGTTLPIKVPAHTWTSENSKDLFLQLGRASITGNVRIQTIDVEGDSNVLALGVATPGRSQSGSQCVLLARASRVSRNVALRLGADHSPGPRALISDASRLPVTFLEESGSPNTVHLVRGGPIATVFSILPFEELRLLNDQIVLLLAIDAAETKHDAILLADTEETQSALDQSETMSLGQTELTPELEDSPTHDRGAGTEPTSWSLWSLIGKLFLSLWNWLFPPVKPSEPAEEGSDGEDEDDYATRTPIDERTPLLRSPQIAQTGPPSTMSSPALGSGPLPTKISDSFPTIDRLAMFEQQTHVANGETATAATQNSIRYTFRSKPPFTFYLPPMTETSGVLWQIRRGLNPWSHADVERVRTEGFCDQITVKAEGDEPSWEVQIGAE